MKRQRCTYAVMLAALVGLTACSQEEELNGFYGYDAPYKIEYTVGLTSATASMKDEAQWDRMLDWLIQQSTTGTEVTFRSTFAQAKPAATKAADTCRTTSREVIRAWCQKMEKAGKTVTLTYDSATGTYTGTAYAARPRRQEWDAGMLVGCWNLEEKALWIEHEDLPTSEPGTHYSPESPGVDIRRWVFQSDGTVLATLNKNAGEEAPNEWETHPLAWSTETLEGMVEGDGIQVAYTLQMLTIKGRVGEEDYAMTWTVRECGDGNLLVEQNAQPKRAYPSSLAGGDNILVLWRFARTGGKFVANKNDINTLKPIEL